MAITESAGPIAARQPGMTLADVIEALTPPSRKGLGGPQPSHPFWRFFGKVRTGDGCWEWMGYRNKGGWGMFTLRTDQRRPAHRQAYEWFIGPIPDGFTIDHLCRNRACVNPTHLEAVTRGENTLRGKTITAANRVKTHCSRGHEFTSENTYLWRGHRHCRACQRARWTSPERRARRRKGWSRSL